MIGTLPNIRIQRMIQLNRKLGHKTKLLFTSKGKDKYKTYTDFREDSPIAFESEKSFYLGKVTDEQISILNNLIDEFDPEVLHVHDIFMMFYALKSLSGLHSEIAIIYDDHEYWSLMWYFNYKFNLKSFNLITASKCYYKYRMFKRWEKKYVHKTSVVTVSKGIRDLHIRETNPKNCIYIPNMPTITEISSIPNFERAKQKTALHIGEDFTVKSPLRFTGHLLDTWKKEKPSRLIVIGDEHLTSDECIQSIGKIPHSSIYKYIGEAHFGLLPYLPHPFHDKISPNKMYMYAHGGALPVLPTNVYFPDVPIEIPRFSSVQEIIEIVRSHPTVDPQEIKTIAKKSLVMDIYLDELKTFYENL